MAEEEKKIDAIQDDEQPLLDYAAAVNGEVSEKKKKSFFAKFKPEKNIKAKTEVKVSAFVLFLCATVLVVITIFGTIICMDKFFYGGYAYSKSNKVTFKDNETSKTDTMKVAKFQAVLDYINKNYYTNYDINDLIEGAIKGVVNELGDPYSTYYTPTEMNDHISFLEGTYSGIGMTIAKKENGYLIVEVTKDSPAEKAGVKAGDIMTAINGETAIEMEAAKFNSLFETDGNVLSITFLLADGTSVERKITVSVMKKQTVITKKLEGDLVYIRITQFVPGTADSFKFALEKISSDTQCKGIILDLRNNPGGYADEASKVADYILPEGIIATSQNRKGETINTIKSDANCISLPITVIINENTASAAELLAGAIRDNKYGKLVGMKSYGKALAQTMEKYSDGSGISLSSSRYFTPSGECIDGVGITPDVVIDLEPGYKIADVDKIPTGYDIQLYTAMEQLGVISTEKIVEKEDAENNKTEESDKDNTVEGAAAAE